MYCGFVYIKYWGPQRLNLLINCELYIFFIFLFLVGGKTPTRKKQMPRQQNKVIFFQNNLKYIIKYIYYNRY